MGYEWINKIICVSLKLVAPLKLIIPKMIRVQIPRYDVEIKNKTMFSPTHVHSSFVFIFGMCISVMECFIYPPLWERTISNGISPGCIHASQSQSHVRHLTSWEKTWRFHSASIWAIDDLPLPLWVPAAHRSRFKPFQTHNLATTKQTNLDMSRLARQPPMTLGVRRQTTWMSPRPFSGRSAMQTKWACPLWRIFFATWSCMS